MEFKLHSEALCESFGIKCKPTSVNNPQANAILEQVHQVITTMIHTTELDMANTVVTSDIDAFLTDAAWVICSTYHTVLNTSPHCKPKTPLHYPYTRERTECKVGIQEI